MIIIFRNIHKTKCITEIFTFLVSNQRKFIAKLNPFPIHFRQDFAKYRIQKVMKVIVNMEFK